VVKESAGLGWEWPAFSGPLHGVRMTWIKPGTPDLIQINPGPAATTHGSNKPFHCRPRLPPGAR